MSPKYEKVSNQEDAAVDIEQQQQQKTLDSTKSINNWLKWVCHCKVK